MPGRKAFTFIELMIVVVILGILAVIVVPKFSDAALAARAGMLADDLRVFRMQSGLFRAQHYCRSPGYPDGYASGAPSGPPTEALFVAHMTRASNAHGETADPGTAGFSFGPYFSEIPKNPLNDMNTVKVLADNEAFPVAGQNNFGWIYKPATERVKPDTSGADEHGKLFFDY